MNEPKNVPIPAPPAAEETIEVTGVERAARPPLPTRVRMSPNLAATTVTEVRSTGTSELPDAKAVKSQQEELLARLQRARGATTALRQGKEGAEAEILRLKAELDGLRQQRDELLRLRDQLEVDLKTSRSETAAARATNASLNGEIKQLKFTVQAAKELLGGNRDFFDTMMSGIEELIANAEARGIDTSSATDEPTSLDLG